MSGRIAFWGRVSGMQDQGAASAIDDGAHSGHPPGVRERLSRLILASFVLTFIAARVLVFAIMARWVPDLYLHVGGGQTHVHHLNYGIFLLSGVGAYLLLRRPVGKRLDLAAVVYGIGLALTFDEFGMWLHLGGAYWQRSSFDAVVVIAGVLALFAAAPRLRSFTWREWLTTIAVVVALAVFSVLWARHVHLRERLSNVFQKVEAGQPK
jgi:hypothetical protein